MFKCTYVVSICPCPTVSKQKPVDGSHTSHHHLLRSGLGGGGFDLFYEAPYTLVFKSGALKAAQPSSLHIWSDLSSRMPCHPKAHGRQRLKLDFSFALACCSPYLTPTIPFSFLKLLPCLHFVALWSSPAWRNGSSSTAEEPQARVSPHKYLQLLLLCALSDGLPAAPLALNWVSWLTLSWTCTSVGLSYSSLF